jgi:hypothetical protein
LGSIETNTSIAIGDKGTWEHNGTTAVDMTQTLITAAAAQAVQSPDHTAAAPELPK